MLRWRNMIDIHCHYLPGVDDGAETLEQGLELLRRSVDNGINRIVLTPHIHPGRYHNTLKSLRARFAAFQHRAERAHIPVQIALGGEVRFGDELLPMLEREEIPLFVSAAGEKTLLLEFPHHQIPPGAELLVQWLRRNEITPLIAHPERNKELMKKPERLQPLLEAGALAQVTAAAVIGKFGERAQVCARYFLDNNWVAVIATDAHNVAHRPPLLLEAATRVAKWYGEAVARRLVHTTPNYLCAGNFGIVQSRIEASSPVVEKPARPDAARSSFELSLPELNAERNTQRIEPLLGDGNLSGNALQQLRVEFAQRADRQTDGFQTAQIFSVMRPWQAQ